MKLALRGYINPDGIRVERLFVRVEAAKVVVAFWHRTVSIGIHRGVMLVAECNAIARLALTTGLGALSTDRLLFVTFQLSLSAGQTVLVLVEDFKRGRAD